MVCFEDAGRTPQTGQDRYVSWAVRPIDLHDPCQNRVAHAGKQTPESVKTPAREFTANAPEPETSDPKPGTTERSAADERTIIRHDTAQRPLLVQTINTPLRRIRV